VSSRSGGFSKARLERMADVMRGYVYADFWTLAYQAITD
jgi:hypothetical protein